MRFTGISYLELWQRNHLCKFGRGYYEEQFCEIILNLGQWFKRYRLKDFFNWSSGSPPDRWSRPIYAILKEVIMGNIHVKLYEIWTRGSGGKVILRKFMDGLTADGHRPITIAHLEPSAQVS